MTTTVEDNRSIQRTTPNMRHRRGESPWRPRARNRGDLEHWYIASLLNKHRLIYFLPAASAAFFASATYCYQPSPAHSLMIRTSSLLLPHLCSDGFLIALHLGTTHGV